MSTNSTSLERHHFQDAFFSPRSIAVIGATPNPLKLGYATFKNIIDSGFAGRVYPINPNGDEILGCPVFHSILDVPDEIDLAVIIIAAPLVPSVMIECGKKNVKGVIVISGGFREMGGAGVALEDEIIAIAKKYGMRLVGPNCIGLIDTIIPLNTSFTQGMPQRGNMAFMTQSGALAQAVLDWAAEQRIGLSRFASIGNKADCAENDFIEAWGDDEHTQVILAYLEDVHDGRAFINIAKHVGRAKQKPIIAIKSGVTQAGRQAVSSHTGSLAGSEQAYRAAFKQAGVVRAHSMETLFDYSIAFAYQPVLRGKRIALITNAGGVGVMATDAIERAGLQVAQLEPGTIQELQKQIPSIASALNPIDVRGDAYEDRYEIALRLALQDPNVDGVMAMLTPQSLTRIEASAQVMVKVAREANGKTFVACLLGGKRARAGVRILMANGVPNYPYPERAADALRAMWEYRTWLARPAGTTPQFDFDRALIRETIAYARNEQRTILLESETRAIARAMGLPIPQTELARNADEVVAIAKQIGYPVVFKIASPDIVHKSDMGGVQVGIANDAEARAQFHNMLERVTQRMPSARILGVTVQQMIPPGKEVLVGLTRDPQFGAMLAFGMGGVYVEVLNDVTFRIAPITTQDADEMMREICGASILHGVRGEKSADLNSIADVLLRVSQLAIEFPEIVELDVNPLVAHAEGVIAIDVRIVIA